MSLLLAIYVLFSVGKNSYAPIKGAIVSCDEVATYDEQNNAESGGEMAPTDSRGHIVFSGPLGTYHCGVQAKSYSGWTGVLLFDEKHRERYVVLSK